MFNLTEAQRQAIDMLDSALSACFGENLMVVVGHQKLVLGDYHHLDRAGFFEVENSVNANQEAIDACDTVSLNMADKAFTVNDNLTDGYSMTKEVFETDELIEEASGYGEDFDARR